MPLRHAGGCGLYNRVCALLEEGTLNVETIDPGCGVRPGMITRVAYAGARTGQPGTRFR
jgi:hypothetical protein